jgi:hypothetical protein
MRPNEARQAKETKMRTLLSFVCLLVLVACAGQTVFADVAKPKQPEQKTKIVLRRSLELVPDGRVWQAKLQLTQSDLQELRAALDGASGDGAIAAGTGGFATTIALSSVRTIVAGVLLFLSVSFAGVWLARSARKRTGSSTEGPSATSSRGFVGKSIAVGILVVAMLGAAAIITHGNAGPPPGYFSWMRLSKNFAQGRTTSGDFVIEVIPDEANRPPGLKLLIPYNPKQTGDE